MEHDDPRTSRSRELHSKKVVFSYNSSGAFSKESPPIRSLCSFGRWALYLVGNKVYITSLVVNGGVSTSPGEQAGSSSYARLADDNEAAICVTSQGNIAFLLSMDGTLKAITEEDGFVHTLYSFEDLGSFHRDDFIMFADEELNICLIMSKTKAIFVSLDCKNITLPNPVYLEKQVDYDFDQPLEFCTLWGFEGNYAAAFTGKSSA